MEYDLVLGRFGRFLPFSKHAIEYAHIDQSGKITSTALISNQHNKSGYPDSLCR
jgi:hypothetical protein